MIVGQACNSFDNFLHQTIIAVLPNVWKKDKKGLSDLSPFYTLTLTQY
jgi:hypothetical protein